MTKKKNAASYEKAQMTHGITLREKFPQYRTIEEVRQEIASTEWLDRQ